MNRSFKHRGLKRFWESSDLSGIPAVFQKRIRRQLDALDQALKPQDLTDLPGYKVHPLKGQFAGRYAMSVSGNLRMTFGWDRIDAIDIDLEDYH